MGNSRKRLANEFEARGRDFIGRRVVWAEEKERLELLPSAVELKPPSKFLPHPEVALDAVVRFFLDVKMDSAELIEGRRTFLGQEWRSVDELLTTWTEKAPGWFLKQLNRLGPLDAQDPVRKRCLMAEVYRGPYHPYKTYNDKDKKRQWSPTADMPVASLRGQMDWTASQMFAIWGISVLWTHALNDKGHRVQRIVLHFPTFRMRRRFFGDATTALTTRAGYKTLDLCTGNVLASVLCADLCATLLVLRDGELPINFS